ncbi:MAG: 23S rRNA (uracil(1939)-C(5))-methyltransferase RlmD [Roseiflexus sp.]|nr:23S rRNA (uracil(1939)-C(5))-methyltransferase RlmD [Roseiflexus sp.]MCS7289360.1 23S rRNA (uracil(1939)-C(5))-methyltransferase RlmD [Roseiflexus sp.]MDW8231777.1 23S rRNA (uracil(1939)-C(5))-methyltransferase RlmD [Roseiflexaceae bacterium]
MVDSPEQTLSSPWPDILELTLDGIAQGGEAVGRWQNRVVFAAGGIPGERVVVRLRERHESYARGDVIDVLLASADRVAPRLPGASHMPWQHIAFEAQQRLRRQILVDQLAKFAGIDPGVVDATTPASKPWEYRNNARLHCDGRRVGYYEADTRSIYELDHDPLLHPTLNEALAALHCALADEPDNAPPLEVTLRVSEAHGYCIAALRGRGDRRSLAVRWRARCPALAGVVFTVSPPHLMPPLGADTLVEELEDLTFLLRPTTFFQVNVAAATTLLNLIRAGLGEEAHGRLLDLYCGAGAFTLPLARNAVEVVGVEEYAGAVADAERSAAVNHISNVRFITGRAEAVLTDLSGEFDAVVLDPPRRGCHPRVVQALIGRAPRRIVYVSCHPATLARDLKSLINGGYTVVRATPVDLFPQTPHVESVVVLVRAGSE